MLMNYKPYYEYSEKYDKLYNIAKQKENQIRLANNQTAGINKLIMEIPEYQEKIKLFAEYKEWFDKRFAADSLCLYELKPSYFKNCKYAAFYVLQDDVFNRNKRFCIVHDKEYTLFINGQYEMGRITFKPIKQRLEKWFGNCRIQPILRIEAMGE